jgi:uncharacterized protein (DUF1330 family)
MNRYITGVTLVVGIGIGAAVVQGLHAQTKPPAFVIVENAITDRDAYLKEYLPLIQKSIRDQGGKRLAAGGETLPMVGEPPPKSSVALFEFESLDKVRAFADSPATKDAVAVGNKYATIRFFAVEGFSQ